MSRLRNRRLDFDERKIFDDYLLWDFDTRIERTTALYEESCRKEKKVVEKLERRKSKFLVRYARVWKILRQIRMQEYGLEIVTNKIQSDENAARKHFDAMSENVHAVKEREKNEMRKMNPNESHGKLVKIVDELQVARDQRDKAMFDLTRAIQKREVFREVMDGLELLLNTPLLHTFLREKHFAVAPPLPQIPVRVRQSIDAGIRGVSTKIESSQNLRGGEQLSSDGDSRDDHAHSDSESDNTEEDEDDSKPPLPPPTPQMRTTNFKGVSPSNAGDTTAADETEVSSTYTSGSSPRFLRTFGGVSSCSVEASQVFDGISRLNSANRKNYFLEERRVFEAVIQDAITADKKIVNCETQIRICQREQKHAQERIAQIKLEAGAQLALEKEGVPFEQRLAEARKASSDLLPELNDWYDVDLGDWDQH